jgi:hypothetical protein
MIGIVLLLQQLASSLDGRPSLCSHSAVSSGARRRRLLIVSFARSLVFSSATSASNGRTDMAAERALSSVTRLVASARGDMIVRSANGTDAHERALVVVVGEQARPISGRLFCTGLDY